MAGMMIVVEGRLGRRYEEALSRIEAILSGKSDVIYPREPVPTDGSIDGTKFTCYRCGKRVADGQDYLLIIGKYSSRYGDKLAEVEDTCCVHIHNCQRKPKISEQVTLN